VGCRIGSLPAIRSDSPGGSRGLPRARQVIFCPTGVRAKPASGGPSPLDPRHVPRLVHACAAVVPRDAPAVSAVRGHYADFALWAYPKEKDPHCPLLGVFLFGETRPSRSDGLLRFRRACGPTHSGGRDYPVSGMRTLAFSAVAFAIIVLVFTFLVLAIAWGSAAARETGDRLPRLKSKGHRAPH